MRTYYCRILRGAPYLAFVAVGLVNILSGGASAEWGFLS